MRRILIRIVFAVAALVVLGVGLLLLRNYEMAEGVRALKDGNGMVAVDRLKPVAQFGDKTAQLLMGSIYAYGWGGVPKDDATAIYWFRRCGSFGPIIVEEGVDPAAPHELSVAKTYATGGEGVQSNPAESIKWLKLAAKGGSKEAAAMLAHQSSTSR